MHGAREPRDLVAEVEAQPRLPDGPGERFMGYGVMGLPFRSGHLLALRCFPASSIGPGYRSVWHRAPDGRWIFFQDVPSAQGCARYFGADVAEVATSEIAIDWHGPWGFSVGVTDDRRRLDWSVKLAPSPTTRTMNRMTSLVPESLWRNRRFLAAMGVLAGPMLHAGKVRLVGRAPNGQLFIANPFLIWLIKASTATLDGIELGAIGPASTPGQLADFRIPQRGVFAIGTAFFEPVGADVDNVSAAVAGKRS
jgi:hypothetical protein